MTGYRKSLRYLGFAVALTLVLAACAPATIANFFAPCPQPTDAEWAAAQEQWLASGRIDSPATYSEPGEVR